MLVHTKISPKICLMKTSKKVVMVNFTAILCDGSTEKSITEHEVVSKRFVDQESGKPTFVFFKVVAPSYSQDAAGALLLLLL